MNSLKVKQKTIISMNILSPSPICLMYSLVNFSLSLYSWYVLEDSLHFMLSGEQIHIDNSDRNGLYSGHIVFRQQNKARQ